MLTQTDSTTNPSRRDRPRSRVMAVLAAVAAAALVWLLAVPGLGVVLRVHAGGHALMTIGLPQVLLTTLAVSLAGWGVLALLERYSGRPRTLWSALAAVVLLLSCAAPLTSGAGTAAIVVLRLLHVTVAAVLIPGLTGRIGPRS